VSRRRSGGHRAGRQDDVPARAPAPTARRAPVRTWGSLAVAVLVGVFALVAWRIWPGKPAAATVSRPDVLLVTIDTLRADHLGCYGNRLAATPVIDGLAAQGARFAEAIAQVPLTLPSHASILTGMTPVVHGVHDNAGFSLGKNLTTLAEVFFAAGYDTAAFVSAFPVHGRFGLGRGFHVYDDRFPRGSDPSRPAFVERRGDLTVAAAVRWLQETRASSATAGRTPVFVWLHLFDPHAPYEPPEPFLARFRASPYDGEVAFADQQLGAFLAAWRKARGDGPLVAVASDHGEGLGEHGEPTHGLFIYDSTLRVPLVVAGPGVRAGRLVTGAVRTIDIAPTLLDFAGLGPLSGAEGRSLRGAIETGRAADEPVYSESLFARLAFGWAPLHGWRERGLMAIDAPTPELYDTAADPGQTRNLAPERADATARLLKASRLSVSRASEPRPASVSRDTAERLRSLGYVASSGVSDPSLRDPKDAAGLAVRIENAMAVERAQPARAAAELSAVLREDPNNALVRRHLAMALAGARRFDEAIGHLRQLVAAGDDSLETLTLLADCQRLAGRPAEAATAFKRVVGLHPDAPEGHDGLGKSLVALGRHDDAGRAFERALAVAPGDAEALAALADLALVRGDTSGARAHLEALTNADETDSRAALKLGVVLVREGEVERAIGLFRSVIDREPGNAEAAMDLAAALAKSGRAAEAVPYFERAVAAGTRTPAVWNGLAAARLESGNATGAAEALRASLHAEPNQPRIRELLEKVTGGR
jgi:choline-sulfatase